MPTGAEIVSILSCSLVFFSHSLYYFVSALLFFIRIFFIIFLLLSLFIQFHILSQYNTKQCNTI